MMSETEVQKSGRVERTVVRVLQVLMLVIFGLGVYYGNSGVFVNAGVGLLVTLLPGVLKRRYDFTMNVGIVLWISVAMFLHAFGTLPLPGLDFLSPYKAVWWWDHMTHALSSSLVAGAAYAVTRALMEHTEYINMPPRFMFAYLLVFVMAFGVLWELLEFYIGVVSQLLGAEEVLTQYGLDDTVLDLMYNTLGGLLVAIFGTAHLTGISDQLRGRLEGTSTDR
ncbi:hypothetical protein GJR96_16610 [Haloferax sp. MBLA0076]|uniref:DUF2238 domain-containing protein n=1 Tax=Haloferax litoreum TaxID=2666140 RepID=A0A6A8GMN8_9EURY|nr:MULTISPECIES: hypothetical protein [Haloferax]KAB1190578.1 hypothetical protein Hfx1148_16555 [Haloferax sp. CBA1148]MRX23567.1 hypothetical protein [Haloferax litoreum]